MDDKLTQLGWILQSQIDQRIADKQEIENRWLSDLRQYHGKNTPEEESNLVKSKKSRIFVNITRNKCNAAESRLIDLLFPTDDRNWGIKPTPVPELDDILEQDSPEGRGDFVPGQEATKATEQPGTGQPGQPGQQSGQSGQQPGGAQPLEPKPTQQTEEGQQAKEKKRLAKKKATAMENEINDQLKEARYSAEARDVIHDAVALGSGIIKGPIVVNRNRKKWHSEEGIRILEMIQDYRPGVTRVSPWDFFPDLNAKSIENAVDVFERKRLNKKQLQDLAKNPGYLPDQIRKLLKEDSDQTSYDNMDQIREISGAPRVDRTKYYDLWEYHGPVDREDLISCGIEEEELEDDPLHSHQAVIVFCNGTVLKASLNPLETQEMPYSVFCWEEDEAGVFGYGVPYRMRSPQKVINAAWRMIMDNAGQSVGPQIVMRKNGVEPADGLWEITGRKLWFAEDDRTNVRDIFAMHEISSHQAELQNIFQTARQLADEETNLPVIAQGEQTENVTDTARGMSMLMQSANTILRRAVRSFDDNLTVPLITRFYDWNMQNSDKEEIKGDFEIIARGSSELAERAAMEQGINDLVSLAQSPVFGPLTDEREMYKRLCKSRKVDPEGLILSKGEVQQPQPSAEAQIKKEELKLQAQKQQAELQQKKAELAEKAQHNEAKLTLDYEMRQAELASKQDMTMKQLQAQLEIADQNASIDAYRVEMDKQIKGIDALQKQNELDFKLQTGRQGI